MARTLARAVGPDRLVLWRAFVYDNGAIGREELVRQAYDTFMPLDGRFDDNVIVQIKNGPMDFQIREPLHPLLGGLKRTHVMMEVQAAQEYTGQQIHATNLVTMWSEYLQHDTVQEGPGSTIAKLLSNNPRSGMACVGNLGNFANWTGHVFAAANTYGFGALAWAPERSAAAINAEWTERTFPGCSDQVHSTVRSILSRSRAAYEGFTSPLGIGFIVFGGYVGVGACAPGARTVQGYGYLNETCPASPGRRLTTRRLDARGGLDHYWVDPCSNYGFSNYTYGGLGCDRTARGTRFTEQYAPALQRVYDSVSTTPTELLLWFHHLSWSHPMPLPSALPGNSSTVPLFDYIAYTHAEGVREAGRFLAEWGALAGAVDEPRFAGVRARFAQAANDAAAMSATILAYYAKLRRHGHPIFV